MTTSSPSKLISGSKVAQLFDVKPVTIWRWQHDQKMGFPPPVYIRGRKYFRADDIEAFIARFEEAAA